MKFCCVYASWRVCSVLNSVSSKKIIHLANACFRAHLISQPCRRTISETLCKLPRTRFPCTHGLVVLWICAC